MKYKLLQNAPNADKGDIFDIDASSRFEFYTSGNASYHKDDVENNPDWFASFCFTTEDGVDKYEGDSHYYVHTYGKGGVDIGTASLKYPMDFKKFSTKQAAEKYLEPKFKVGDYFVYDNEVHKIDNIKISSFISNDKCYDKALCRKADNSEIISYYEKLSWIKGAKFRKINTNKEYIIEYLHILNDSITVHYYSDKERLTLNYKDINCCELIKEPNYPKSWKDLKEIDGVYITSDVNDIPSIKKLNCSRLPKDEFLDVFKTEKQALSCLAFAQLSQLVAEMNQNWQPNWSSSNEIKYVIRRYKNNIACGTSFTEFESLAFKSKEARDFSFQHHNLLWKQYWQI